MRKTILILLLAATVFAQPQWEGPEWEEGTYWVSHRYSDQLVLSYTQDSLIHSYVWDSFCRQEPTYLTYSYTNFTISRITFPETNQKLTTRLPLLDFPLHQGKSWETSWTVQKTHGGTIYKYPVTIQVLGTEPFEYHGLQKSYLLNITLNNTIDLLFHYVPANSTFPGQPPMEVYEEIESGQPFVLFEYGVSDNPSIDLTDYYKKSICPKESLLQRIIDFLTKLLRLRPS